MADLKKEVSCNLRDYFLNGYVLVVDDAPNVCKTTKNLLRSMGIEQVIDASDGDIALKILKNKEHSKLRGLKSGVEKNCLFALLDWYMGRMSGIDLAQEIRADKELENIPILMITAEGRRDQIVQASAEVGVNGFILKPFSARDLETKISAIIKQRINPPEHVKLIKAGEQLMEQGKFDGALMLFAKAQEINPNSARVHVLKGDALKEKGKFEEARSSFAQAIMTNPNYLKIYVSSADLAIKEGNKDLALGYLKKASEISPCNGKRIATMGQIHLERGEVEEAQKAFEAAIKEDPKTAKDIAEAYLKENKADLAEDFFRRSMPKEVENLSQDQIKEYVHTANRLGIALRRQGKIEEALDEYQKARKLDPEDEAVYYNMGKAYLELSKKKDSPSSIQKAVKCFRKAVEMDPEFEEALRELEKLGKSAE
ncbi:MAG: tetratricopeptide repeat protein [Nitrospinae bacterium]|nr:tetratricopeptide repeat protein [Nitrospinota bacterium]